MAWTFDLPSCLRPVASGQIIRDMVPSNVYPAYDGKNLWYVNEAKTGIVVVDFWGPYNDILNGVFVRHLAQEDDEVRLGSRGPSICIRALCQSSSLSRIQSITYMDGAVYALHENGDVTRYFTDLRQQTFGSSISVPYNGGIQNVPRISVPVFCRLTSDLAYLAKSPINSDIVGLNGKLFYVDGAPKTQTITDGQELRWFSVNDVSGISPLIATSSTTIPGRKQLARRNLTTANDCVYVTAFNELNIYKFGSDGSSLSTILVNRDVENVFTVDAEVWVISSNKSELTFTIDAVDKDVASYMLSKISAADVLTHIVGLPVMPRPTNQAVLNDIRPELENMVIGHDGNNIWSLAKDGNITKIKLSGLSAILGDPGIVEGDDFNLEASHTTYACALNGQSYTSSVRTRLPATPAVGSNPALPAIPTIANMWVSPAQTYQWYDGEAFVTISVPRHLVLLGKESDDAGFVLVQRLPGALKYQSSFKTNQYVALSSGPRRYKAD